MGFIIEEDKLLIKNSTREERKRKVETAVAISKIDSTGPSQLVLNLFQKYIDGIMEMNEIDKEIDDYYRKHLD